MGRIALQSNCKMYKKNAKKDQFRDALIICMRTKSFSDVTISDLSRVSNVSRVTFYRYFSNTTDVLEQMTQIYDLQVSKSMTGWSGLTATFFPMRTAPFF